jgi:hypothetical protein
MQNLLLHTIPTPSYQAIVEPLWWSRQLHHLFSANHPFTWIHLETYTSVPSGPMRWIFGGAMTFNPAKRGPPRRATTAIEMRREQSHEVLWSQGHTTPRWFLLRARSEHYGFDTLAKAGPHGRLVSGTRRRRSTWLSVWKKVRWIYNILSIPSHYSLIIQQQQLPPAASPSFAFILLYSFQSSIRSSEWLAFCLSGSLPSRLLPMLLPFRWSALKHFPNT